MFRILCRTQEVFEITKTDNSELTVAMLLEALNMLDPTAEYLVRKTGANMFDQRGVPGQPSGVSNAKD